MLERCLEKEARNRYGGISDARVEIHKALADPGGAPLRQGSSVTPEGKSRLRVPWIAAIVFVTALMAGAAGWIFKPAGPRQVMRFDYNLPDNQQFSYLGSQFSYLGHQPIAVSPDGRQLVYSTPEGLYMRSVDQLTATLVGGTEGDKRDPFFSPDGRWIGYFSVADLKLKKVAVTGGVPVDLCYVRRLQGAWWNDDNTIAYGQFGGDIARVSDKGGTPDPSSRC